MRIAKPLLMFSLSVFLLAVSWSLLTGQLGSVGPAHAQVGDPFVSISSYGGNNYALTESGGVWRFDNQYFGKAAFLGQLNNQGQ